MRNTRLFLVMALTALVATMLVAPAAAKGGPPADVPRGGMGQPTYEINWTQVEAEADEVRAWAQSVGVEVDVVTGKLGGAAFIAAYPASWNGDLVMYAHGYRGEGPDLTVDAPPAYQFLTGSGYAWAASSYRRNSYDPGIGVLDTRNLTHHVERVLSSRDDQVLDKTFIAGFSMGGHVTAAAIERYPSVYDGAMPACGVMGDVELFDYFLDYNVGAAAFAGLGADDYSYPDPAWTTSTVPTIKSELSTASAGFWAFDGTLPLFPPAFPAFVPPQNNLTPAGETFKSFMEVGSGGERVTFDAAWDFWHTYAGPAGNFFFDLGEGNGTIANRPGIVAQNSDMSYADEYGFDIDDEVLRVDASNRVRTSPSLKPAILIDGNPSVPVLSIHTTGDLFVPIEMQQIYAEEVAANGKSELLVQRAIRDVGHCSFTGQELVRAYADLFAWVETGVAPAGEVLTGAAISDPALGCDFTVGAGGSGLRDYLQLIEPCPPSTDD